MAPVIARRRQLLDPFSPLAQSSIKVTNRHRRFLRPLSAVVQLPAFHPFAFLVVVSCFNESVGAGMLDSRQAALDTPVFQREH